MKTTFRTAALALALSAMASAADLSFYNYLEQYENFNTDAPLGSVVGTKTDVPVGAGSTLERSFDVGAQVLTLDTSALNLNATTGFSVAFHMKYSTTVNNKGEHYWKDPLKLTIGGETLALEVHSSGKLVIYGGNTLGTNEQFLTTTNITNEWHHIGLTFQGDTLKAYLDGVESASITLNSSDYSLTQVADGTKSNTQSDQILLDNIGIFSAPLEQADYAELKNHAIPEPATATLSLLALTGLAARRRRK